MKQKLFPLCVALLALVLCNTPLFAEDFTVDGICYKITSSTNKTVAVTYYGSSLDFYSGAVTIPESVTYSGSTYSVTSIGNEAFTWCEYLTSVEIPNSVTSIGEQAFWGCFSLTSVEIGNSVTNIGDCAFQECYSLTSVVIPNSVTSIGNYAFYLCESLTSVVIPNSVTNIGYRAFSGCPSLTSIVVAEDNATYDSRNNCNAIIETQTNTLIAGCSETTIPNSVTSIGDCAFQECPSLTSVVIPNSVTSIGSSAFAWCSSLISVEIPNSVTSIGKDAFSGTAWYNNQPDGVVYLDTYLLHYKGTMPSNTSIEIKDGTSLIADCAFQECHSLTSVEIPNSVIRIGVYAFDECSSLTSVVIPNSVTYIGWAAFYGCDRLKTATVGCSWITNPLYQFAYDVTVNATLHSYENGVCTVCGEEETTGIDEITSNAHQRSATFDLQGRHVNNAGKGLYIVNGKKVIMK